MQIIGSDLSRIGGYYNAVQDAITLNANCLQIFTNSPRRLDFAMDKLKESDYIDLAKAKEITTRKKDRIYLFIHSPYIINLCDMRKMTLNAKLLRQQLEVCDLAGGVGVVVHTGSQGKEQELHHAYEIYVRTVRLALQGFNGKARILIETSAGQGRSIGVKIIDFARLYNAFSKEEHKKHMGIVIDTCHIFAAGYNISTVKGVNDFVNEFHKYISWSEVKLFHLNDSKKECGTCVDRHAHLKDGFVYQKSTDALSQLFRLYPDVPFILETHDKKPYPLYQKEITLCRKLYENITSHAFSTKLTRKRKSVHIAKITKQNIVRAFQELAEIYYSQLDAIRGDSYYEAAHLLEYISIPSTRKELKQFPGIGDSIADKTIELLYTGKMKVLDTMKKDVQLQSKIKLLRVAGIGIKTSEQLSLQGIHDLESLQKAYKQNKITLTNAQELGLIHYADLQKRIPHKEAKILDDYLQLYCQTHSNPNCIIQFVGSYRRKKKTSGDIDILLCNVSIDECIEFIKKKYKILSFITHGKEKTTFLMKINTLVRHIDLLTTTPDKYVTALTYFTGSKFFNIRMRLIAKQLGYTLNEHGLFHIKTKKKQSLKNEAELFSVLNMKYMQPEYR